MSKAGDLWRQSGEGELQPGAVLPGAINSISDDGPSSRSAKSSPSLVLEDVVLAPPDLGPEKPGEPSPRFSEYSPTSEEARLTALLAKRGLTKLQIDEILGLNHRQQNFSKDLKVRRRLSQPASRSKKRALKHEGAAPGVVNRAPRANDGAIKIISILMPSKQAVGQQLISNFLVSEKEYCSILECLTDDYYPTISEKAKQGKFQITRSQVDDIFRPVDGLVKLHRSFYSGLYLRSSISKASFSISKSSFFYLYIRYMRNCTNTVNNMQNYCRDSKLQKCLSKIRKKSRRRKDDMVDLLLKPLNRIIEYKHFFLNLCSIVDKTEKAEYEFLVRASRNISRAASYIEQHKFGIENRNEMNKIQKFLGDQCNVFGANRNIIRQGMMYSQSKGWTSRNKQYVFFLFTDILVWTTKKGDLQNAVYLKNCQVLPSFSKSNRERKFQIEFSQQIHKPILLECKSQQQRNEWYFALSIAVKKAQDSVTKARIGPEEGIWDEEKHGDLILPKGSPKDIEKKEGEAPVNFVDELNYVDSPNASSSGWDDFSYNRFEHSKNYLNQEFAVSEFINEYSSVEELRPAKRHSVPILDFNGFDPAVEIKAAFRRAVIMSPGLKKHYSDGSNGVASFSIRRNSLSSGGGARRGPPKQEAARLSRVEEENRIYGMGEKESVSSKSESAKDYQERDKTEIRWLAESSEEIRAPPGVRRRSLFTRYSKAKKDVRRHSCATPSRIPGSQKWAQPGFQPGAQPGAQPPQVGRRGSFFKISLNDFNET